MEKKAYLISERICEGSEKVSVSSGGYYRFILTKTGSFTCKYKEEQFRCGVHEFLMLKPGTSLVLSSTSGTFPLELLSIQLSDRLLEELSGEEMNFKEYFEALPSECISVTAENSLMMITKNLISDLAKQENVPELGDSIYRFSLLSLIAVFLARAFRKMEKEGRREPEMKEMLLDSLMFYIKEHITEEIPLARLEREFNISQRHILREFKKGTGQTVHSYIIKTKLALCARYIAEGMPISDVYTKAGFGGYNHFFRAFKKEFQMTPGEYYQICCQERPDHKSKF
ncbi:MAG: helix-turn-helix transcriptional regulator [Lachnospiraceae bacterium]|nr:helix-turn-helix transcriptional regulator [Lachnospiraceae bacterium]